MTCMEYSGRHNGITLEATLSYILIFRDISIFSSRHYRYRERYGDSVISWGSRKENHPGVLQDQGALNIYTTVYTNMHDFFTSIFTERIESEAIGVVINEMG